MLAAGFLILNGIQYCLLPAARRRPVLARPGAGRAAHRASSWSSTVNAVNFVDGLDGLAAGRGRHRRRGVLRFSLPAVASLNDAVAGHHRGAAHAPRSAGACVGFLPHNIHPARIFMGDSGSMLIGLVLVGERDHPHRPVSATTSARAPSARRPACCRPCCRCSCRSRSWSCRSLDLVLAVVRRTRAGRSPFAPDKQHLHHRLLEIGHSQRRAVLIMWMWAALVAFGTVLVSLYTRPADVDASVVLVAPRSRSCSPSSLSGGRGSTGSGRASRGDAVTLRGPRCVPLGRRPRGPATALVLPCRECTARQLAGRPAPPRASAGVRAAASSPSGVGSDGRATAPVRPGRSPTLLASLVPWYAAPTVLSPRRSCCRASCGRP